MRNNETPVRWCPSSARHVTAVALMTAVVLSFCQVAFGWAVENPPLYRVQQAHDLVNTKPFDGGLDRGAWMSLQLTRTHDQPSFMPGASHQFQGQPCDAQNRCSATDPVFEAWPPLPAPSAPVGLGLAPRASQSQSPATILFRGDYTTEILGFDFRIDSPDDWQGGLLAGGCDDGTPAYELRQLPGNPGDAAGQHYWGHAGVVLPSPRLGETRFIRFRVLYDLDNNFRGRDGGHATNKMLIVNQGCDGRNCRVILNTEQYADWGEPEEALKIHYRLGTDGGVSQITAPYQERGVWHDIQIMLRHSTAHNRADGEVRLWINNDDFHYPTAWRRRILNVGADASGSGYIEMGAFNNAPLDPTGSHTWRHCGFEVGTTFDPIWDRP